MATLFRRQKPWEPLGSRWEVTTPEGPAWWPGGRMAQKAFFTSPRITRSIACVCRSGEEGKEGSERVVRGKGVRASRELCVWQLVLSPNSWLARSGCYDPAWLGIYQVRVPLQQHVI